MLEIISLADPDDSDGSGVSGTFDNLNVPDGFTELDDSSDTTSRATSGKSSSEPHRLTALRPAVRREERVNVYIDDQFFCSLDLSQVVDQHLKVGQILTAEDLTNLQHLSAFGKLYNLALNYVISRPHSEREVCDYLKRKTLDRKVRTKNPRTGEFITRLKKGYDPSLIEPVLSRLRDRGYIDDGKFVAYWLENRRQRAGISRKRLILELKQKGINQSLIDDALNDSSRNDSAELQKVIARRRSKYSDKQKFIQYLTRQGFNYSDVVDALSDDSSFSDGSFSDGI